MNIEIVESPRPDDDVMVLPTYREILDLLCDEFNIPGSPCLWNAIQYIKKNRCQT